MRQNKVGRRELRSLIIVLERLIAVALRVERPRQMVATLRAHGFIFSVVERVQGKMLNFRVVLEGNILFTSYYTWKTSSWSLIPFKRSKLFGQNI